MGDSPRSLFVSFHPTRGRWKARTTLEEGVAKTVEFFRRHRRQYWNEE